ncbi:MAG: rod shape-determining protein RodA [Clostridia bacterium]|nr:rod shape-determining protein RodA [Clostridia bacterium]
MFYRSGRLRGLGRNLDLPLTIATVLAALFGLLMIASAGGTRYVVIQSAAFLVGVGGVVALMILDYQYLSQIALHLYLVAIGLLVLVLIPGLGDVQNGARSWFDLGFFNLQPAELAKIVFIITFSKHLAETEHQLHRFSVVLKLLLHLGSFCVLILLQPDFGTAMVFVAIALVLLFCAGIGWKYILGGLGLGAITFPLAWFFFLQDYQKNRILTLFQPELDPTGAGYHVMQSKIAVGSGRIFGTGLFKGSSQVNNLLPERHTDFIFSAVCEELGMLGGVLVILLLSFLIIRCIYIGINARNRLGTYMCVGVASMFLFQVFENVGMCLGIFPVTGITLPFFSYGGSSMLTSMLAVGLVLNIRWRSRPIHF